MIIRQSQDIVYTLTYKKVKNINLRVRSDLSVAVSANKHVPIDVIDKFVQSKSEWIKATQDRISNKQSDFQSLHDIWQDDECLHLFESISDKIYPFFSDVKPKPKIVVKFMKSRWGVCHVTKGYITLNKALIAKPIEAIEYVVLHEYVHFLHPNHQKGFHNTMQKLMPDYKERRKLLK